MNIATSVLMYIVIWWITLFTILPWGIRSQHETGEEIVKGTEPGAPVKASIGKRLLINTLISTTIWGILVALSLTGLLDKIGGMRG